MEFNVQLQLAGLLEWMHQQMAACYGKTAVIGISGGKDSSTVAALAVAAYGKENVMGVLMPDGVQPDIDYSNGLVDVLGIPHVTINIHDAVQGVVKEMERVDLTPSRQTLVNLPSRVRMATLYAVAQTVEQGIVINTSNLSEDWVGYCTIYGDSAGAFSPLGMYTTEEVIALGRALGLPEKFLIKPPSDGLTGLTDEDNLGFTYHAVNEYIRRGDRPLRVLDIGTGPGFYAIILARRGYDVTAVDYSEGMLREAKRNAGALADKIRFARMDAQKLAFADGSFDAIVTRNLTWNLPDPAGAYREWMRVLRPGGALVNFDANWYAYLFNEDKQQEYQRDRTNARLAGVEDHEAYAETDMMEGISRMLPMGRLRRPQWDMDTLNALGFSAVNADTSVGKRLWNPEEKINYASTPGFMVWATK